MTDEERYIAERVGRTAHFKVPEGYFDQLSEHVIRQLPLQQHRSAPVVRLRPWLMAAASVAAVVVMVLSIGGGKQHTASPAMAAAEVDTGDFMDDAADYAMLDNMDIYACLAEN